MSHTSQCLISTSQKIFSIYSADQIYKDV